MKQTWAASGYKRAEKYAHNIPQSNDGQLARICWYMGLRLLGEMQTKLSDEAYAKHNEAYVIDVAYSNLRTQISGKYRVPTILDHAQELSK